MEKNFDIQVETVNYFDKEGDVLGRPDQVELDIIIKNGLLIICELKSSVSKSEMYIFERKVRFYEKRHNRKSSKMIVISPMVDPFAQKVADKLGIEVYKYLDKSFTVFPAPLKVGLQPTGQYRRVANPARAMLGNLWPSTYACFERGNALVFGVIPT